VTTEAIETRALTRRFGSFTAVEAVDLGIHEGELFGLLGPNGAGKTTVIRMLTGLTRPSAGSAHVAGIDVARDPDGVRRAIGVVPQALTSDLDLTGHENMDIYARFFMVPRSERVPRIEMLLRRVELWERRNDLVSTYSGGMRRRLEIARGLVHRPRVLFLDEPTIGLDPQSRHVIWDLLRELRHDGTLTIVLTTHYLEEAEALCDRVAIVDRGRVVALGTPTELKARSPGSDTIEIGLGAAPPEAIVERVRTIEGVREVVPQEQGLLLHVDGGAQVLPKLMSALTEGGANVTSASVRSITLEDAFIGLTGRSLRDAHVSSIEARRAALPRRFS